jgi:hypothetical protein
VFTVAIVVEPVDPRVAEQNVRRAVAEDRGTSDIVDAAPRSSDYRTQFGADARPGGPQASAFLNAPVNLMNAQIREIEQNPPATRPVTLLPEARYLFRTDPGHRNYAHRIPGVPRMRNKDHYEYSVKEHEHKHSPERRAYFEDLARRAGGLWLKFTVVARKQECYFETDDEVLAGFVRAEMAAGKMPNVYEDAVDVAPEEKALPSHRAQAAMRLRLQRDGGGKAARREGGEENDVVVPAAPPQARNRNRRATPPPVEA